MTNRMDAAETIAYTYDQAGQVRTDYGPWASDTVTLAYNNRLRSSLSLAQPNVSARLQSYGCVPGAFLS